MRTIAILALAALSTIGGNAMAKTAPYQLWVASALKKVLPQEPAPARAPGIVSLFAAKGERESGQIVISAGTEPLRSVRVSTDGLTGPAGARIRPDQISILKAVYIDLPNLKRVAPDPLPPADLFDVEPGKNQPVWVIVSVPRNTPAGAYEGDLLIEPANAEPRKVPISLRVWDFALPEGPSSKTAFGITEGHIAQQHGVPEGSTAHRRLVDKYYRFLVDHWVSPYYLPVPVTSPRAGKYISDPRVTGYIIPYSDDVEQMRASVESLRKRGLLDKAYFYPIDEPFTAEAYKRLTEVCGKIHQVDPKLRIVIPYFRDPDYDTGGKTIHELADGSLNIWCPNIQYFDGNKERLYAKLDKGEEFWWYVCCGPGEPYPNYFLSMDGPSHRALPWLQWMYRCQGLLYWSTTYWNPQVGTKDPWEDMATVKDINKDLYGDGSLLYPGKKVGIDGPVGSIRLELLREGLEDYEYLVLLEKKLGRAGAERLVSRLITSPTRFSHDPAQWEKVRKAIGDELSK